jgi:predicted unusual protein kinase regulating ubiquinone biosynthesis (AarF/ABC1/UbiB family)
MWLAEKLFDMPSKSFYPKFHVVANLSVLCVSDLTAYRPVTNLTDRANYVSEQMRLETSFKHEAGNARRCAELLAQTPELRDDVYVPRVFGEAEGCKESDRIMVMEWVDGVRSVKIPLFPTMS